MPLIDDSNQLLDRELMAEIASDYTQNNGHIIDKNAISIPGKTIKRLGSYTANIRLHREVSIQYPFDIIPE